MLQHVISTEQFFDKTLLKSLFDRANEFSRMSPREYPRPLAHLTIATLFFEPSTRTRLSFETAIQNLGGQLITVDNASEYSSAKKGESLEDTITTINSYADGIVLRHAEVGSAKRASAVSRAPVINAGDGGGEHPTQALLDMFTIYQAKAKFDGLKIALVGDLLNGRTVHSLIRLLALYEVEVTLVSPKALRLPIQHYNFLRQHCRVVELTNWETAIDTVDVLYMTRIQQERFAHSEEYEALKDSFILNTEEVSKMKPEAIILHPLPRVNEIDPAVDNDRRARYFDQVKNGLYIRMSLLDHLFTI